jgi:hypothetical protein
MSRAGASDSAREALSHLRAVTGVAVGTLEDMLNDPEVPVSLKVRAANSVLRQVVRLNEVEAMVNALNFMTQTVFDSYWEMREGKG